MPPPSSPQDQMTTQGTLTVTVARKAAETPDICLFEFAASGGAVLPLFSAGAHIDVHAPNGLVRQYSLCNNPDHQHTYQIAVLRDPKTRGGSQAMHDGVHEGDLVRISGPRNHFPLVHGTHRTLLLAGGIGVTPILCMAERLAHAGAAFEMHYCTRSRDRTAFLQRIEASGFAAQVNFHFDDGPREQLLDLPALIGAQPPGTHLYVCGPTGFIDAVVKAAREAGWPEERVHLEYFTAEVASSDADQSFDVQIASTGDVFTIPPDKSIIEVLARNGVDVPCSCEQGVCGTCVTRILEGEPDHRDHYLTEREHAANDQFTPCCSRAKSSLLVLDL